MAAEVPLARDRIILPGGVVTGVVLELEKEENIPSPREGVMELDEHTKRILNDLWDRFKYAETKITRDSDHYITRVEKLVADHRITTTYKRDDDHYITFVKVRVKQTTEFE